MDACASACRPLTTLRLAGCPPAGRCRAPFQPCPRTSYANRPQQQRQQQRWQQQQRRGHPRAASAAPPPPAGLVAAGPATPPPDYSAIDAQPLNRVVYGMFRRRMAQAIGSDSSLDGWVRAGVVQPAFADACTLCQFRLHAHLPPMYAAAHPHLSPSTHLLPARYAAIIDLTRRLNAMHATPAGTQETTVNILRSLFPPWLPPAFAVMFSRPMPGLSCQVRWDWGHVFCSSGLSWCCERVPAGCLDPSVLHRHHMG